MKDLQRFTRYITKYSSYTQNVEPIGQREQSESEKNHYIHLYYGGLYNLIKRPYLSYIFRKVHEYLADL